MNTNPWIHICDALPRHLVNQARPAANDGCFHLGALLCRGCWGTIRADQFWPGGVPVVWLHVPAHYLLVGETLNGSGAFRGDCPVSGRHLRQVRKGDFQGSSQCCGLATLGLDVGFKVHLTLAFAKVYAAFAKAANAKLNP